MNKKKLENSLIRFPVKVFYRFKKIPDLVFCEIIEIACGSRVNAKKYAQADFEDLVSENCPDYQVEILGIRINQTKTAKGIFSEIKDYESKVYKDNNLEAILRENLPEKAFLRLLDSIQKNNLIMCDEEELLKVAENVNGIGIATLRRLKNAFYEAKNDQIRN